MNDMLPYLVTLGLLAIWAITHIFNREGESLPPRAGRPPNDLGSRPQPPGGPARRPEPPMRWSPAPGAGPPARPSVARTVALDDDIVILEPEPPRRAPAPARPAAGPPGRRPARGRAPAASTAKRTETPSAKPLGAPLTSTLAPLSNRPVDFKPLLRVPHEGLSPLETVQKPSAPGAPKTPVIPAGSLLDVAGLVNSADRLRESFILSEIVRPPVALRDRRR